MGIPSRKLLEKNILAINGLYFDDYLEALNKFAPVKDVFENYRNSLAKGDQEFVGKIVMGTIGKAEYENHLVDIVMSAARMGKWTAVERETNQLEGLDAVVDKNFGYRVEHKGKTFLVPSASYAVYCKTRLEK